MNFKELVAQDNQNIFINQAEFAELMTLNISGEIIKDVKCILDEDIVQERQSAVNEPMNGVWSNLVTLYINELDLPVRPTFGELIIIARKRYQVISVLASMGVLEIKMEANLS